MAAFGRTAVRLVAIGMFDRSKEEQGLRMQTVELVVLWSSLAIALYTYVVYPLLVGLASRFVPSETATNDLEGTRTSLWPKVTLVIASRREENLIVNRLRNAAALNYPPDRLEIVVGCDGEGDLTALLARSFEDPRVKVVQLSEQRGMTAVLNECTTKATGEILVFSDANTMMRPDALRRLVRHFQHRDVGAVCGKLLSIDPTTGRSLSGLFWKFETFLSRCEARLGSLSRINGGIYAIRSTLCTPSSQTSSDSRTARMRPVLKERYRLVYDDSAIAVEETPPATESDSRARLKSAAEIRRCLRQVSSHLGACSILMVGAARLHKRLRQISPLFLVAAFVSNACLSNVPFYLHLLLCHELFYLSALIGLFLFAGSRWRQVLIAPARLARKATSLLRTAWETTFVRREGMTEPTRTRPATNQAAR